MSQYDGLLVSVQNFYKFETSRACPATRARLKAFLVPTRRIRPRSASESGEFDF